MSEWSKLADTLSIILSIATIGLSIWVIGTLLLARDTSQKAMELDRHEKKIKQRLKRWKRIRKKNEQRTKQAEIKWPRI